MVEEWGALIIKANVKLTEAFAGCGISLVGPMKQLARVASLDPEALLETLSTPGLIKIKSQYIELTYDCAAWLAFSDYVSSTAIGIEFYACHRDEYGTIWLYSLAADGARFSLRIDVDEDDLDDETKIEIGRWIRSVPAVVKELFPDIMPFDAEEYIDACGSRK